ncbi:MAG: class I SAM-dependent methyltransferase [Halobacteriota archaeon]
MTDDTRIKLNDTAALVMSWAAPLYTEGMVGAFFNQLDLSRGRNLRTRCDAVCPWYGEVIRNRKHFIRRLIERELRSSDTRWQVVIPAAGMSPLALELLVNIPERIARIIEVDVVGMKEKHALYGSTASRLSDRVSCVTLDITSQSFSCETLRSEAAYNAEISTIVLFEGISYYIAEEHLRRAMSVFQSERRSNRAVLEYMLPCELVKEARRAIPRGVFEAIGAYAELAHIQCYSPAHVEQLFESAHGEATAHYYLHDMEQVRTGGRRLFVETGDGWVGCTIGAI